MLRRERAWLAGTIGLATALAAVDAALQHNALLLGLLLFPPIVAGARLAPRQTAVVAAYATALAILLGWPDGFFGTTGHLRRIAVIAVVGALSVWIATIREGERGARRRYSLLAEVGTILQSRLDFEVTLIEVAQLIAREVADWCFVFVKDDDGPVRQLAAVHREPDRQRLAWELLFRYPLNPNREVGPANVIRTGRSELHREVPDELLRVLAWDEENLRLLRALGLRSAILAPLSAHGRTFGAIVFATAESGRVYDERDLELAAELTNRVAISVDNALLYSRLAGAERELRASRDELRGILDGVADGVTVQDRSGKLVYANQVGYEMLGASSLEELLARPIQASLDPYELLDEEGRPFRLEQLPGRIALEGGRPEPTLIRFRVKATGEERWSIVKATPVYDDEGEPILAINVIEEVTQQREREEAARFLGESSAVLSSSLEYEVTLANVARLAVPRIADWCSVDVLADDGSIRNVAVAHADPDKVRWAHELNRRYPPDPDDETGVANVLRTGRSELYADVPEEMLEAGARDAEHLSVIRELGIRSAMVVPMVARGRTLGAITFVAAESGRRYDDDDLLVAEELAGRCGLAVDNARLYRERSYIARTLQESLLPPHLPDVPGLDVAARFRAAGQGFEVGGDFYDLYEASEGRWAVVIGDVCGKGAEAAAITALARYTLRAAAMREASPARILDVLNQAIMRQRTDRRFCTVLYAYAAHVNGGVGIDFSSGGHPLPIVVRAGNGAREVGTPGTVIGIAPDPDLAEERLDLHPGDALVLYTDGVTDAHAPERVWSPEELTHMLEGAAGLDADGIAAMVLDMALGDSDAEPRDDIAVLVIKVPEPA
ncbi:MAG: SpoIIE family protein phosphatase [Thermoleophilaceae bacterium]